MPELPEVEYAASVARRVAAGRTITNVRILHAAQRKKLPRRVAKSLVGDRVERVDRRGKTQLFRLASGRTLGVHFRMNGDWIVDRATDPPPRFARASIEFDDGARLVLEDSRALSVLEVHRAGADVATALGPEATDAAFSAPHLLAALRKRRSAIKLALLDQRVVAGLGNIYAAEALWRARLSPQLPANALDRARASKLVTAIRGVLRKATRNVSRYYAAGRSAPNRFDVYDREGRPCRRCGTPIKRIVQGARSTYFCPSCQRKLT